MANNITAGIDIGTHHIKVVVAELVQGNDKQFPKVLATGLSESRGLRHGYIVSHADAAKAIRQAVSKAEKVCGFPINRAFVSMGGVGLLGTLSHGSVSVSRGDSEITDLDIEKAQEASEHELPQALATNRKIIHSIPVSYRIDGRVVLGRPQGMRGMKLESKMLFITCLEQHLSDLVQTLGDIGIEIEDVMAAPLAASLVTLNKTQKVAGCVLAIIGSETVSIVVFENNVPISLEVFPIGSIDVTHDIALGLKISLEEAELLKTGATFNMPFSRKKLDDIIDARFVDMFELIENHLKKIGRNGLLPAGIILSGGGSNSAGIEELARNTLKLPAKISQFQFSGNHHGLGNAAWNVAYGLCILGFTQNSDQSSGFKKTTKTSINKAVTWLKQFLP